MKKILSVLILLTVCGIFNFCSASGNAVDRKYGFDEVNKQRSVCESDSNYTLVYDGGARYITGYAYFYSPSVEVKEYNPPHYKIAGYFYELSEKNGRHFIADKIYYQVRYNWDTKETWHLEYFNDDGDLLNVNEYYWKKDGLNNYEKLNRQFADALFRAAYGMDFYGY